MKRNKICNIYLKNLLFVYSYYLLLTFKVSLKPIFISLIVYFQYLMMEILKCARTGLIESDNWYFANELCAASPPPRVCNVPKSFVPVKF